MSVKDNPGRKITIIGGTHYVGIPGRFMRWSLNVGMGVMPRYVKTPVEITDLEVLEKHPYVQVWKELFPFTQYLPQYTSLMQLYNITQADTITLGDAIN